MGFFKFIMDSLIETYFQVFRSFQWQQVVGDILSGRNLRWHFKCWKPNVPVATEDIFEKTSTVTFLKSFIVHKGG